MREGAGVSTIKFDGEEGGFKQKFNFTAHRRPRSRESEETRTPDSAARIEPTTSIENRLAETFGLPRIETGRRVRTVPFVRPERKEIERRKPSSPDRGAEGPTPLKKKKGRVKTTHSHRANTLGSKRNKKLGQKNRRS